jgi:sphingomyelin phosphodiesterase
MSNDCGRPSCCRPDSGLAKTKDQAAQKWGDLKCDLPETTLQSMLTFIRDEISPDILFWGGDTVPHNVETQTAEDNINTILKATNLVTETLSSVKTYVAIGNHDTYP